MTFRNWCRARTRTRQLTSTIPARHATTTAWQGGVGVAGQTTYLSRTASGVQVGNQLVIARQVLRGDGP